jgi:hypothetical protein
MIPSSEIERLKLLAMDMQQGQPDRYDPFLSPAALNHQHL